MKELRSSGCSSNRKRRPNCDLIQDLSILTADQVLSEPRCKTDGKHPDLVQKDSKIEDHGTKHKSTRCKEISVLN
jgi:hypothetical protein